MSRSIGIGYKPMSRIVVRFGHRLSPKNRVQAGIAKVLFFIFYNRVCGPACPRACGEFGNLLGRWRGRSSGAEGGLQTSHWQERIVCSRCGCRQIGMVIRGTTRGRQSALPAEKQTGLSAHRTMSGGPVRPRPANSAGSLWLLDKPEAIAGRVE